MILLNDPRRYLRLQHDLTQSGPAGDILDYNTILLKVALGDILDYNTILLKVALGDILDYNTILLKVAQEISPEFRSDDLFVQARVNT